MRRNLPSKKVNDDPSANGGLSVWLLLMATVLLMAGMIHLARRPKRRNQSRHFRYRLPTAIAVLPANFCFTVDASHPAGKFHLQF